ncbi:MAG: hypothetical protein ACYDH5_20270 [Acidimicrobiales bacterium]
MRALSLDPIPAGKIDSLHETMAEVGRMIEECLDWIEADPVDARARRRRFSNGMWAIVRSAAGSDWLVLWEEPEADLPVVRFIGETSAL